MICHSEFLQVRISCRTAVGFSGYCGADIFCFPPLSTTNRDWWFCATAVPLIAATQGPLSNVLSIAALVNVWRVALPNNGELPDGADDFGISLKDPQWYVTQEEHNRAADITLLLSQGR